MLKELNKAYAQQATVNTLFIHDHIKLLNELQSNQINSSFTSLNDIIKILKNQLSKIQHQFTDMSLIEPLILQHYIYNQFVFFQQQTIDCYLEIIEPVHYKGDALQLIKLLNLIFESFDTNLKDIPSQSLTLSIIEDYDFFTILLSGEIIHKNYHLNKNILTFIKEQFPEALIQLTSLKNKEEKQLIITIKI